MHGVGLQAYSPVCAATAHAAQRHRLSYGGSSSTEADETDTQKEGEGEQHKMMASAEIYNVHDSGGGGDILRLEFTDALHAT